jgi:gas vesicle protein
MGAGAGAAIGTFLFPGIGTLVGGVLGGVAGWLFGPSLAELKAKVFACCVTIADQTASSTRENLVDLTQQAHNGSISTMRAALEAEVRKYNSWIEGVLAAEQRRIDAERTRLRDLLERAQRIEARAAEMTKQVAEVARESSMMSRTPRAS